MYITYYIHTIPLLAYEHYIVDYTITNDKYITNTITYIIHKCYDFTSRPTPGGSEATINDKNNTKQHSTIDCLLRAIIITIQLFNKAHAGGVQSINKYYMFTSK